jgi:hypothetical protein
MLRVAQRAAGAELATKRYRNRTGDLAESTAAELVVNTSELVVVSVSMGEHYASYVVGRGFSDFHQHAGIGLVGDLGFVIGKMNTKIANL